MTTQFSPKGKFKTVNSSVLTPENAGLRFIINLCGMEGKYDSPLEVQIGKRWTNAREDYKYWHANRQNFKLGSVNTTAVGSDTWVVNLLCKEAGKGIDLKNLELAAKNLGKLAKYEHASVHCSSLLLEEAPPLKDLLVKYLVDDGTNLYIYEPTVK